MDDQTQRVKLENTIIIKKNTPIPCEQTEVFHTVSDGQDELDFQLTQGEDSDPDFVNVVLKETMRIPSGREAGQPIEVTYKYDENQLMTCVVHDVNSGKKQTFRFEIASKEANKSSLDAFLVE